MIADEMHGRGYYNVIMMYYRWRRSMEYAASVPRLTDGASAWQAVLLLPRGLHRSDRDDDRRPIWCMAANQRCAVSRSSCSTAVLSSAAAVAFAAYPESPSTSISTAPGIGVVVTNLVICCTLFLVLLKHSYFKKWKGSAADGQCPVQGSSRAGHADQLVLLGLAAPLGPPAVAPCIPR